MLHVVDTGARIAILCFWGVLVKCGSKQNRSGIGIVPRSCRDALVLIAARSACRPHAFLREFNRGRLLFLSTPFDMTGVGGSVCVWRR